MSETFELLRHLFLSSIPTVIFFIILLVILQRLFFRPVAGVMRERATKTTGALDRAREQALAAEVKSRQYEDAVRAARQEIYSQRQEEKRKAQAERDDVLRSTRERAEALMKSAEATLAAEVSAAKQQLTASCQALAEELANRIISGGIQPDGGRSTAS
ncbi:MAG TPA: ATP synthase F0 subunit B [Terriglobia bacterium]|nr:ATP synthase F0 subunit B [Terriglobia bacterium]